MQLVITLLLINLLLIMNNPFSFGKAVEGMFFTDRIEDTKRLSENLTHGINTILISPRRWGKTSLVKKVISDSNDEMVKFVYIDIFQCKSESDFLHLFATEVIKQTSSKFDEWVEIARNFLSNISPKLSFGTDPLHDFSLSFEWTNKTDASSILSLPEKIATKQGVRVVVCIDEFQQIADFRDSLYFQKRLRSSWQHQQNATYCMFGSKRHLMENMFNDTGMPFFKFGDIMFLDKISTDNWVQYICYRFKESGKEINASQAMKICELTENLSSYVQHLCWIVWYKSGNTVKDNDIQSALEDLLEQNKVFFQREIEQVSDFQLNFLRALAFGVTSGFSKKDILKKYSLESSANVQSIKRSLIKKDLIYIDKENKLVFTDPLLRIWIRELFSFKN